MFVVKANHEADDKGKWGLEWAVVGQSGSGSDEQIEEEAKCGETDGNPSDVVNDE